MKHTPGIQPHKIAVRMHILFDLGHCLDTLSVIFGEYVHLPSLQMLDSVCKRQIVPGDRVQWKHAQVRTARVACHVSTKPLTVQLITWLDVN